MQNFDIVQFINRSFREKNAFSIFLTSFIVLLIFIVIGAGIAFYYRAGIFEYFAKEYLISSQNSDANQDDAKNVTEKIIEKQSIFTQEYFVVDAVKKTNPAVVSIVISKEVPTYEVYIDPNQQKNIFGDIFPNFPFDITPQYRQNGTERKEIGGGSGFFVTSDGLIVTNKHVVEATDAFYTVFTNDGKQHEAKVVARDPVLEIALIKIEYGHCYRQCFGRVQQYCFRRRNFRSFAFSNRGELFWQIRIAGSCDSD